MPLDIPEEENGVTTREVPSVAERAKALGLTVPPDGVCALPRLFFGATDVSELTYEPNTAEVKVLLRKVGVTLNTVQSDGVKIPFREDRDNTWVTPTLYITSALLLSNPGVVTKMVEAIGNYAIEMFRSIVGRIHFTCIVKTDAGKEVQVSYKGPPDKFSEVTKHIEKLAK